jgi:hypothetical protein
VPHPTHIASFSATGEHPPEPQPALRYALRSRLGGAVTVLAIHADGSTEDLNATGKPCATETTLKRLINRLREAGAAIPAEIEADIYDAFRFARSGSEITV